ncbi:hypothetical protein GBAR_LOCUS15837 [Geodia barretti]|uniref:Uncharacterized protein n=1 Tax=Geodia barretti TaxID=519541 RepID=A0AA35SEV8_GEOBA|nr:hypothetical protein GBAR_LOCUS15837 [Geodia barretti]
MTGLGWSVEAFQDQQHLLDYLLCKRKGREIS